MFVRETANLKPEEVSPQNRRAACYLHYDLATIALSLYDLKSLLEALSCLDCTERYLKEAVRGLGFLAPGVEGMAAALAELSNDVARAHKLSLVLIEPDWWQQVEERKGGVRIEKTV